MCHVVGSCQCFYNNSGELKYTRIRHYDKVVAGKPKFIYHAQTLSYVSAQIEKLDQQNLSRGEDFNTVALRSSIPKDDDHIALGHNNADLENKESSTNRKPVGWSSSLVRTLALRAKGRRSESGSAHHSFLHGKA